MTRALGLMKMAEFQCPWPLALGVSRCILTIEPLCLAVWHAMPCVLAKHPALLGNPLLTPWPANPSGTEFPPRGRRSCDAGLVNQSMAHGDWFRGTQERQQQASDRKRELLVTPGTPRGTGGKAELKAMRPLTWSEPLGPATAERRRASHGTGMGPGSGCS